VGFGLGKVIEPSFAIAVVEVLGVFVPHVFVDEGVGAFGGF